jgi:four helix bundle protein
MDKVELQGRTRNFAVRIVKMFKTLPRTTEAQVVGKQVLRSGTSVAANYRAVCRSRSKQEFIARLGVVVEEIDETVFWLDMLVACEIVSAERLKDLSRESEELLAIFTASQLTAKGRRD